MVVGVEGCEDSLAHFPVWAALEPSSLLAMRDILYATPSMPVFCSALATAPMSFLPFPPLPPQA